MKAPADSGLLEDLGTIVSERPFRNGRQVKSGLSGRAAAGLWAAGNVANVTAGVMKSAVSGVTAAAAINADLTAVDTDLAVAASHVRSRHSQLRSL